MILVQAKDQEKLCSKNTVFIPVPIASALITNLIVDQHQATTLNNEPIEEVDLEAPNVVMDKPLEMLEGRVGL